MTQNKKCPECGEEVAADAPDGLCPLCLLKQGFGSETSEYDSSASSGEEVAGKGGIVIRTVEETVGRYTHLGEHGKGGMGRVLIVHDEHLERDIALKELLLGRSGAGGQPTPITESVEAVGRFLREARITGRLEHPSITPVYELGRRKDGTLYYTMKLVRGQTLAKGIREAGTLENRLKLLPHFVDLCHAIAYAHSRGVIHRDIKPANIMLGEFGETVVIDWGLAKVRGQKDSVPDEEPQATVFATEQGGDSADEVKTRYGQTMGTPVYMPPEQAKGDLDAIDEKSDIYSLGAVLYEIITGHAPFGGQSLERTLYQVINEDPVSANQIERMCPPDLAAFCKRAMNKNQAKRFPSAQELASAVQNSKLKAPKSRLRRAIQYAALGLVLFLAVADVIANIVSERDLKRTLEQLEKDGIATTGQLFSGAPTVKALSDITRTDPLEALYLIPARFPVFGDINNEEGKAINELHGKVTNRRPRLLPLQADESEAIRKLTAENNDLLTTVRAIAAMPRTPMTNLVKEWLTRSRTLTEVADASIPVLLVFRECGNLLMLDAYLAADSGDYDKALRCCADLLRISCHFHESTFLITAMIRCAMDQIAMGCAENLNLGEGRAVSGLAEFRNVLKQTLSEESMQTTLKSEMNNVIDAFHRFESDPGLMADLFSRSNGSLRRLGYVAGLVYSSWPLKFWRNWDEVYMLGFLRTYILLSDTPYYKAISAIHEIESQLRGSILDYVRFPMSKISITDFSFGSIHAETARLTTKLDMALVALALLEYQRDHSEYPKSLDVLKSPDFDTAPQDPFTGQPFVYEPDAAGFKLRSPGVDGVLGNNDDVQWSARWWPARVEPGTPTGS